MKKEYMIPQLEEIVLKSKGTLLVESESVPKSNDEVEGGLAPDFFGENDNSSEDW